MKKYIFILMFLLICSSVSAATFYSWRYRSAATDCTALTDGKTRDLCFEIDDEVLYKCQPDAGDCTGTEWKKVAGGTGGSGDVTGVGDCTTGACLDGTSDGGTYIKFYDAQGAGQFINGNLTAARVWTLPDATGTVALTTSNVATASALASNPAAATAGSVITNIAADGSVEAEVDVWTEAENTSAGYTSTADEVGTLNTGDICTNDGSNVQCTVNTIAELETALDATDITTSTELATGLATQDTCAEITGCVEGALTAETNSLETTITGIADTEIFIGDGANSGKFASLSGDVTMGNTGGVAIGNDKIDSQHYAAASIDLEHMASQSVDSDNIKDAEIVEADINADETPADNDIMTFDATGDNFSWQTPAELGLAPLDSPTFTTAITATGLIGDEDLQNEDFGEFTCAGEDACTIDDSVAVTSWNLTTPTITTSLTADSKTISEAEIGRLDGLTSAIIDDDQIDTFSKLDAIVVDKDLVNKADGADWLGVHDYSDAFITLPSTIGTVEGAIRWSSAGKGVEVYTDSHYRATPTVYKIHKTIWDPDGVQSTEDAVPIFYVNPSHSPYGITIGASTGTANDGIQLFADAANTASVTLEEWSYEGVHVSDIVTITFGSSTVGVPTSALSDAEIAAGNRIFVDFDTTALNWLDINIPFWIKGEDE